MLSALLLKLPIFIETGRNTPYKSSVKNTHTDTQNEISRAFSSFCHCSLCGEMSEISPTKCDDAETYSADRKKYIWCWWRWPFDTGRDLLHLGIRWIKSHRSEYIARFWTRCAYRGYYTFTKLLNRVACYFQVLMVFSHI